MYIHITRIDRKPYLVVHRGKHRTPTILDPEKMMFMLPFPPKAPILEDINSTDDTSLGSGMVSGEDDLGFDF